MRMLGNAQPNKEKQSVIKIKRYSCLLGTSHGAQEICMKILAGRCSLSCVILGKKDTNHA